MKTKTHHSHSPRSRYAATCLLTGRRITLRDAPQSAAPTERGPGGAGHERGGPRGQGGFHLLPPRAAEQLKLTDEQQKQIAALETRRRPSWKKS